MASTTRESNLFAAEDWTKIYEAFREVNFQSYDYQTVRKTIIDYIRTYYPEDFNDFIESSEYIALIDIIAFLTQSMSFRVDLNARENFLETAQRRSSILRLARMLNYNVKRSQIGRGLLKVTSVRTSEEVFDSNGNNLQDTEIFWGDTANPDFLEQFTTIMNAAMVGTQQFSNPSLRTSIGGIKTEEYNIRTIPSSIAAYEFSTNVNGRTIDFEVVNGTYSGSNYLYEVPPGPRDTLNLIYRSDDRGFNSINTGFFFYFKQGSLQTVDFSINEKLPNRVVEISVNGIDNNDVWLYELDSQGNESTRWTKVPALNGTNVIYNSLSKEIKTLFAVESAVNDRINIVFGDDVFTTTPVGNFRTYFRVGNGLTYKIAPRDMQDIEINIPYVSKTNTLQSLTVNLALQTTISNASARENLNDVKLKAQQQYYTQNRMINAEDYQIFPFTNYTDILKSKAVNRTSSGISRYLDVRDTTGKYSSTNIVASDGILFIDEPVNSFSFNFTTRSDIFNVLSRRIEPIIQNNESFHFYIKNYTKKDVASLNSTWQQTTRSFGTVTGYFKNSAGNPASIGSFASSSLKYANTNSLLKFVAPAGKVFDINNTIITGSSGDLNTKDYIWASIIKVVDDGTNQGVGNLRNGTGPVTMSEIIPTGAILSKIYPVWNNTLTSQNKSTIADNIATFKTFGLRYDYETGTWEIISSLNLNQSTTFSLTNTGDQSNLGLDNSWFLLFTNDGATYTVKYRSTTYTFESVKETRFYFDSDLKVFDPVSGKTVKDTIKVLKVNNKPDSSLPIGLDIPLQIDKAYIESDGFTLNEKIKVTFPDSDSDGVPDDPEVFETIVSPDTNSARKVVFYTTYLDSAGFTRYKPVVDSTIETTYTTESEIRTILASYSLGQIFYASSTGVFYILYEVSGGTKNIKITTDYIKKTGRNNLLFQYSHNAPNNRRIDPSPSNIIDLYILTRQYNTDFRNWVTDITGRVEKPTKPSTLELRDSFGNLESNKSVSDALIFHSINFRPLFGSKADASLQATFKVIKNQATLKSDSEIKANVIRAINNYFALENWDFGDTFYFSELDAYLHQELSPDVLSITIVPKDTTNVFGSLLQITSARDEIFISSATVNDVEIISVITASQLTASGTVVNAASDNLSVESVSAGKSSLSTTVNTVTNNTNITNTGYNY